MGAVYKAHHMALDIPVAVKLLTNMSDAPDAVERFVREARIAARLKHPNIAAVLNVGEEGGRHYLVMEYVDGENLKTAVDRRGKLPEPEVISIALAVLDALCKAHECSVVHRDIKPENILIMKNGTVRLIDLGLARAGQNSALTQPDTILGSPYYVAPEQAENPGSADCRADLYSLGCTLYHLLSGSIPFPGTTVIEVLMNHINKPVPRLHDVVPTASKEFSTIISKMMEKNPRKRYQSPSEAYTAVAALNHGGAAEKPPRVAKKEAKRAERRIVITTSLFLITAIVFFALRWGRTFFDDHFMLLKNKTNFLQEDKNVSDTVATNTLQIAPNPAVSKDPIPQKGRPVVNRSTRKATPAVAGKTAAPAANLRKDQVLAAVKIGDTEALAHLLKEGESPNGNSGEVTTPLHEAVRRGLGEEAQLLLSNGANPNTKDTRGNTPLHYAVRGDAMYLAEILLKNGADPNLPDGQGRSPLKIATLSSSSMEQLVRSRGGK